MSASVCVPLLLCCTHYNSCAPYRRGSGRFIVNAHDSFISVVMSEEIQKRRMAMSRRGDAQEERRVICQTSTS